MNVFELPRSPRAGIMLLCPVDFSTFSTNRDDYFMSAPGTVLRCECGEPMELVKQIITFKPLTRTERSAR